ncbi:Uncharacterized protein Fot_11715 [Forsythia ovata]|uniref:Uncharacterized protein n=1 Tax=Forsythia ovata TaxID=205694 RepID=A0ABD1WKF8_9LAMI
MAMHLFSLATGNACCRRQRLFGNIKGRNVQALQASPACRKIETILGHLEPRWSKHTLAPPWTEIQLSGPYHYDGRLNLYSLLSNSAYIYIPVSFIQMLKALMHMPLLPSLSHLGLSSPAACVSLLRTPLLPRLYHLGLSSPLACISLYSETPLLPSLSHLGLDSPVTFLSLYSKTSLLPNLFHLGLGPPTACLSPYSETHLLPSLSHLGLDSLAACLSLSTQRRLCY